MKKALFCLAFVGLYGANAFCQTDSIENKLLHTVANLRNDSLSGTGVFIQNNRAECYLVTAASVARMMDKNASVALLGEDNIPLSFRILDLANPVQWVYHPVADVAVLKINPKPYFFNKYLQHRFMTLTSVDSTNLPIPKTSPLLIIGFPMGTLATKNYPPSAYHSFAVSGFIQLEIADDHIQHAIVILRDVRVGGFEGGPVFLPTDESQGLPAQAGTGCRMVGFIMHGDIKDNSGRPVTVMTPAGYIYDLIK